MIPHLDLENFGGIDTSQYMRIPTFVPSTAQVSHNYESISMVPRDLLRTCYGTDGWVTCLSRLWLR